MEFAIGFVIFTAGMFIGSTVQWFYNIFHRPNKAGRLLIARDDDGMYMHANIENVNLLYSGNTVEFDVWEVNANDKM